MDGTIIDKTNWRSMGVQRGDLLITQLDDPVAEVVSVGEKGPRRGVVTAKILHLTGEEYRYELDGGRSTYEFLIEFRGYRFLRPDPPASA